MSDSIDGYVRNLRQETARKIQQSLVGWSVESCWDLLDRHGWDCDAALRDARAIAERQRKAAT